jgi:hypothetical protein
MNKFQPATVPLAGQLQSRRLTTAGSTTVDPNPVVAELQPVRSARRPSGFHWLALP